MNRSRIKNLLVTIVLLGSCSGLALADSPIQLALWPPDLQLVGEDSSIRGLRLQIYGRNHNMTGLDIGLVHESRAHFAGVAVGLVSLADESMHGIQWTWLYSRGGGEIIGWQAALLARADGAFKGLQTSGLNMNEGDSAGAQIAFLYNYTASHISGAQIGLVNRATSVKGIQLGLVNLTEQMKGIQIGLWNEIDGKDHLTILPIVNWNF